MNEPRAKMDDLLFEHEAKQVGLREAQAKGTKYMVAQRDAAGAEFLRTWPGAPVGPKLEDYDFGAAREQGEALDAELPNKYFRPGGFVVAGRDLATGRAVQPRRPPSSGAAIPGRLAARGVYDFIRGVGGLAQDIGEQADPLPTPDGATATEKALLTPLTAYSTGQRWLQGVAERVGKLADLPEVDALEETSGWLENLGSDILKFALGYTVTPLRGAGLAGEAARGAVAAQSFDPEEGNISSVLAEVGLLPEALEFLDAKASADVGDVWQARLGMAIEEGALTYAAAGVIHGGLLAARRLREAEGDTLIEKGVNLLFEHGRTPVNKQRGNVALLADERPAGGGGTAKPEAQAEPEQPPQTREKAPEELTGLQTTARGFQLKGMDEGDYVAEMGKLGIEPEEAQLAWRAALDEGITKRMDTLMERAPEFAQLRPYLTPKELTQLIEQRPHNAVTKIQNAVSMMRRIDTNEMAAAAAAGSGKRGWYAESAQALAEIFGPEDSRRFTGLLAALSPQTSVESNLHNALSVWANWTRAGRPTDEESILRIMGESVQGAGTDASVLPAWRANSLAALQADNPADVVLSGPKADSFMRNLQGEFDEVTNDTWMAYFGDVVQKAFAGSRVGDNPGKMGGYLGMSAATRKAAQQLSERTGEQWTGAEVQETVWSFLRALVLKRESQGFTGTSARNLITELNVMDTPDFGTLLDDNKVFHDILTGAGYEENLSRYAARRTGRNAQPESAADPVAVAEPGSLEAVADRAERIYRERAVRSAIREFSLPGGEGSGGVAQRAGYRPDPGGGRQHDSLSFGGTGQRLVPTPEFKTAMGRVGTPTPDLYRLSNKTKSPTFKRALAAARQRDWVAEASVDLKKSYADDTVFLTDNGQAGFAVAPDGEIHSVFSSGGGLTKAMLQAAVENGGKWLYAFDTVLPQMYSLNGFKPVARIPWNDEFAPKGWQYDDPRVNRPQFKDGRPDVVFMVYDPAFKDAVRPGFGGQSRKDFDAAMADVHKALAKKGKGKKGKAAEADDEAEDLR